MTEIFKVGKKYKFNPIKYMLCEGIDSFYDAYSWIEMIKDYEFIIDKDKLSKDKTEYTLDSGMFVTIEWCTGINDIEFYKVIKDTFGYDVCLYSEKGNFKTTNIKLFEELLKKVDA